MPAEVKASELTYNVTAGVPWHGLGKPVEGLQTVYEAMINANLGWRVEKIELNTVTGTAVESHVATVRNDTGAVLGVVGANYEPIQNEEQAEFLAALTGEGAAVVDVAGTLRGGARVFWVLKVPGDLIIGDDRLDKFMVAANGHDGSLAYKIFWTPIRVVCSNTLNAALMRNGADGISIRHTRNVRRHVEEARRVLQLTQVYYSEMEQEFRRLIDAPVTDSQVKGYVEELFPVKGGVQNPTRTENIRAQVLDNYERAPGAEHVRGTAWGAYNAVTYYTSHQRGGRGKTDAARKSSRFEGVVFGGGRALQQRAFEAALVLAG